MGNLAYVWALAVFLAVGLKSHVHCADCSNNADCTTTTFTMSTCSVTTCDCQAGSIPIRTGCAKKPNKPTVTIEAGKTRYLIQGSQGVLTCTGVYDATSYGWYLDNNMIDGSGKTLTINQGGDYQCYAIANIESLYSELSETMTITTIAGGTTYPGALQIKLASADQFITDGREVTLICYDGPMGYSGTTSFIKMDDGSTFVSSTTSMTAKFTMADGYYGLSVNCRLSDSNSVSFTDSTNQVNLPAKDEYSIMGITAVSATVTDVTTGVPNADVAYNLGATGPTIDCQTTPVPEYLDSNNPLTYDLLLESDSSVKQSGARTFTIPTNIASDAKYKCRASYGYPPSVTTQTSASTIQITIGDDVLPIPTITKVSTADLTLGSTLVLSCGDNTYSADSYQWLFTNNLIEGQFDKTIQMYNFAIADIGVYKCRAAKSFFKTAYASFHALMKPTVSEVPAGTIFAAGGDYALKCNIDPAITSGWTYSWKKGSADIGITTESYSINNADATAHDGDYTCTTTYNSASSSSDLFTVTIQVAGQRCTADIECTVHGYSGSCLSGTTQICGCSTNFIAKGESCSFVKGTITRVTSGTVYAEGGDYVLKCDTGSTSINGLTYGWKKDNEQLSVSTDSYTITGATAATHNGSYTCIISYNGDSSTSDALTITVEAPGKRCTSNTECTVTGYTGTCSSTTPNICLCSFHYTPTGETCVFVTPSIIRTPTGTIYAEGGDYNLKCDTGAIDNSGVTYLWKKNGMNTAKVSETYTITGATAATDGGSYTCTITYNGASSTSVAVTVTVDAAGKRCISNSDCTGTGYTGTCTTTSPNVCSCSPHYKPYGEACVFIKPTITLLTSSTVYGEGGDYVLKCDIGSSDYTGVTFDWKKDGTNTGKVSETYTITGATAAKDGGSYTCTITYSGASSASDSFPVTVVDPGKRCSTNSECTGSGYTGACSSNLPKVCLCSLQYELSGEVCVLKKPTISRLTTGTVYVEGGDYILKCNTADNTGLTYLWKKDGVNTPTTTESYTITGATAAANSGSYTCTISINGASSTSAAFAITIEAPGKRCTQDSDCTGTGYTGTCTTTSPNICTCSPHYKPYGEACVFIKPTITREPAGAVFGSGGDYDLKCDTGTTDNSGVTYVWKKDDNTSSNTNDTFKITGATAATDNGNYICTISYSGISSTSDALSLSVVEPGKRCTSDAECTGTGYTKRCTTAAPRVCECDSSYKLKGEACVYSGSGALISCALMVIIASLGLVFL